MSKIVVEVGFILTEPLSFYHDLIIDKGGINTFNCETHDLYWTNKKLDGLSENQMKNSCVRFRKNRGISGDHFDGTKNWKSGFQNYNLYDETHDDSFSYAYEELGKLEAEFSKNNFMRIFDTHKFDYQYMIGDMKSRIQLQQIDDIGLVLYYDNPAYCDLPLVEQRAELIKELNNYGFNFKSNELGIDKLRSLYYKEKKHSLNQNG